MQHSIKCVQLWTITIVRPKWINGFNIWEIFSVHCTIYILLVLNYGKMSENAHFNVVHELVTKETTLILVNSGNSEPSDFRLFPASRQNLCGYNSIGYRAVDNCSMITCNRRQWTSVNGKHKRSAHDTRNAPVVVVTCGRQRDCSIAGLHPQSLCRFAWKFVARVWQTCVPPTSVTWLQLSRKKTNPGNSLSVTADWLIYAHTTSRHLSICDISLGTLMLSVPEAGVFVESIVLYG